MLPFRNLGRKAVALAAAALLASGFGSQAPAQAAGVKAPTEDDQVILQLQVKKYRLRNDLRGYQLPNGGVCVDLGDVILALDLPVRLDKKSRRATGWLFREDQTFTLDRDKNTVQIMNKEQALQPDDIYDTPEGWCIDTKTLGRWFGVTLTPNLYEAVVQLDSETPLPFIQAIERKSRAARLRTQKTFDLAHLPQANVPYRAWRTPSVDVIADFGFAHASSGGSELRGRYQVYASGEIAGASVDARLASDSQGAPDTLRVRAYRNDPRGRLLGPLKATQAAVGDVELYSGNLAGAGGVGRGAFVSNRPLNRSTSFGKTVLRGELPTGWDAELYRNGQLLGFQSDTPDGRYEFHVDLVYGNNDLQVVLYGPQGQIRREKQTIPVGYGAVAPGKLEYWAGVIQQNRDLINFHGPPSPLDGGWQYGFGTQYGLDERTVVGATTESLMFEGRRRNYAELDVQRALGPMLLDLTAAQEVGAGRAYRVTGLGRIGKLNITADTFFLDGTFASGEMPDGERSEQNLEVEDILGSGRRIFPVAFGFKRTVHTDGRKVNEWLARAGLVLPRVMLTAIITNHTVSGGSPDDAEGTSLGLLADAHVLGFLMRANASYRITGLHEGFDSAQLTIEKTLSDRSDLRADIQYNSQRRLATFQAGYVRQFRRLALNVGATADTHGSVGATLGVTFSFSPDPFGHGVRFSNNKLAERGEAAVSVFLDKNGDGIRSPGEEPLPGVGVTAGQYGTAEPTDKQGHAVVEDLNPYQKVAIGVDESTLPDPFLVPVRKAIVVTPRPGVPAKIEIAVAPTGEIEGEVHGLEDTPVAGVGLELVDEAGNVAATTLTEYDGYFLFEQVPYGHYTVRLSAGSARALGVVREIGEAAALSQDKTDVELGVIRLQANRVADAAMPTGPPVGSSP